MTSLAQLGITFKWHLLEGHLHITEKVEREKAQQDSNQWPFSFKPGRPVLKSLPKVLIIRFQMNRPLYNVQQTVTYSSFCVYVNSVFSPRVTSRPCLAFVIVRLLKRGKEKKENEEIILFGWAGAKGSLYPIGCIRCASSVVSCCYFFPFFCVFGPFRHFFMH